MKLVPNWRRILRKAYSVRFNAVAAILSGAEVAVPFLGDFIEPGRLAMLSALSASAGFVARIVAQRNMNDEA